MIGWSFAVAQATPEEWARAVDRRAAVLASWEASYAGLDWVNKLIEEGRATQVASGGYPNRYTAAARYVLPLLANGPPAHDGVTVIGDDYVMPGDWVGRFTLHQDKISACPPDQILTIEVWDQS